MKKLLLSFIAITIATLGMSQVTFIVDPPSPNAGMQPLVDFAESADAWGVSDLNDPANAVVGIMCIARDADPGDTLACGPLVNGADINGKIAVIYRGDCQFGTKALNAQNAGAIAVILISNTDVTAFNMLGADDGPMVTIPVVMITMSTGALLRDDIETCSNTAFIGNKNGFYENDLGLSNVDVLRARQFATPSALAQNDTEFSVKAGSWVHNYGQNTQTNVTLNCVVTSPTSGSTYNETSAPIATIPTGDSVYVALADWSLTSYPEEYYTMTYSIFSDSVDQASFDNGINADFMITDKEYSAARIDPVTKDPLDMAHFQPGTFSSSFQQCIRFVDPNASRLVARGVTFDATTATGTSLVGEIITIEAYTWEDGIKDINDPGFALGILNNITIGEFEYVSDDQDIGVGVQFDEPFLMEDNVDYFFCATSTSQNVFLGFDNSANIDYSENINTTGHVVEAIGYDGNWFGLGFNDATVAITLDTEPAIWLGVESNEEEVELNAYPNPAVNEITIPLTNIEGNSGQLNIIDVTGKIVSTQNINLGSNIVKVNVNNIPNGTYVFTVNTDAGKTETFNVVISK